MRRPFCWWQKRFVEVGGLMAEGKILVVENKMEKRISKIRGPVTTVDRLDIVSKIVKQNNSQIGQFAHIAHASKKQVLSGARNVLLLDEEFKKHTIFIHYYFGTVRLLHVLLSESRILGLLALVHI